MLTYSRQYRGPVCAAIFDLAGTVVDHGSCAPAGAFVELFRRNGIEVTLAQARGPMGTHKRAHLEAMLAMPEIAQSWLSTHGSPCTAADIDRLYAQFIPLQVELLPRHNAAIPGAVETVALLRERDVKVAVTTGYNHEMARVVLEGLAEQDFVPDAAVCAADVPAGRPAPWMIYRAMELLGVYPPQAVVAIGDTIADIEAGLNAGVWAMGVTRTGNMLGLAQEDVAALAAEDLAARLSAAADAMYRAGAHDVADSVESCPQTLDRIEDWLRNGVTP